MTEKAMDAATDRLTDALAELGEVLADVDELDVWPERLIGPGDEAATVREIRRVISLARRIEEFARVLTVELLDEDGPEYTDEEDAR